MTTPLASHELPIRGLRIHRHADVAQVVEEAFQVVRDAARAAVGARGVFRLALAGGSTPKSLYRRLAEEPAACPWAATAVFFGDERCVPPEHPDSNFGMVQQTLLSSAEVRPQAILRMEGERPPPEAAASYERLLPPALDLALLGMGTDGHTASLFPGTTALTEEAKKCVNVYVEKLGAQRLTLTYPVFEAAHTLLFLVTGADKAAPLKEVLLGPAAPERLPSQRLFRGHRQVLLFCDDAAAAALPPDFVAQHAGPTSA